MTKNNTIYLAKITKLRDYEADITLELEAFDSMDKAVAFMTENNLRPMKYCDTEFVSDISLDVEGSITTLKVK